VLINIFSFAGDGNPGNILTDSKAGGTPQSNNTGNLHSTVSYK
jgi:hypothetical protein